MKMNFREHVDLAAFAHENPVPGDVLEIEISTDTVIETVITEIDEDGGIYLVLDETALGMLSDNGVLLENALMMSPSTDSTSPVHGDGSKEINTSGQMSPIFGNAFKKYDPQSDPHTWMRRMKNKVREAQTTTNDRMDEAEYQGREVPLGKPMRGDVAKSKVYVRDPKTGNVKKVNFGDPNMKIKKSNPARRKSFRARHNCDNPGPRTSARYWSCRAW